MAEAGIFEPSARIKLTDGGVLEMAPQSSQHVTAIRLVEKALAAAFGGGFDIRPKGPWSSMNDRSPKRISLSSVAPRCDYSEAHPQTAVLIVAIADSSLGFDGVQEGADARNGIAGNWLFDLSGKASEDHRQPSWR